MNIIARGMGSSIRFFGFNVFGLLFFIGLVVLIIAGVLYYKNRNTPVKEDQAITILKQRFANGEISIEEYQQRYEVLHPTKIVSTPKKEKVVEAEVVEVENTTNEEN